jgi:hypothetical protein
VGLVDAQNVDPSRAAPALNDLDVNKIISQFTSGETAFQEEFGRYGYKLELYVQSVRNGKVVDEYRRVSQILLNKDGKLVEKMLSFTKPSVDIRFTREDLDNFGGPYQFALQASNANQYHFAYVGKEQVNNLGLYVFDVSPVSLSSKRRLFHGRIWVAVDSLGIVKTQGKFEDKSGQKYPVIEMYRTVIDNRFLFPASGSGDNELVFADGQSVHLQLRINYSDFVKLQ